MPILDDKTQLLLDAYALGALSTDKALAETVAGRTILTPDQNEAARLLGREVEDCEDDVISPSRQVVGPDRLGGTQTGSELGEESGR